MAFFGPEMAPVEPLEALIGPTGLFRTRPPEFGRMLAFFVPHLSLIVFFTMIIRQHDEQLRAVRSIHVGGSFPQGWENLSDLSEVNGKLSLVEHIKALMVVTSRFHPKSNTLQR